MKHAMRLDAPLTKENFFDEMMTKYPKAMKKFCDWIDEYKKEVGWDGLFNAGYCKCLSEPIRWVDSVVPKFHNIPYAMQYGIWIEYCKQELSKYFEQPEHISDSVDLEEDIKGVFESMEGYIDADN